ncbi:AAA family ATPase [Jiella pelagia]|uniref:AAA family ATPase n=1 Tax=Jiella pelagia TaxID=2986949 RepID=A0ABY7BZ74_9HYPH|nr:AAA family ATPase [Jiella pelagia]WAP66875.1 AAA family ATPase [Jiella pelagia]
MTIAILVVLSGLPGVGKSSVARALAGRLSAVWLRIDSIEQAILASGVVPGSIDDAGYRAAMATASDNLSIGLSVVADCVNPWMEPRDAWRDLGVASGAMVVEVELICRDEAEHRRRIEDRRHLHPGEGHPDWQSVIGRDYRPWGRGRLVVDTAGRPTAACTEDILAAVSTQQAMFTVA